MKQSFYFKKVFLAMGELQLAKLKSKPDVLLKMRFPPFVV